MSQIRRRFSLHQRSKKVTIGPLGFDVPIKSDPTAFSHDDQVDAEDQLSDVDYSGAEPEREAKRRRIEDHARDYLCGRPLDIYTASLRGPVTKSYWGESAAVAGTVWELRASERKSEILKAERESKRQMIQRSRQSLLVPGTSQKRISVTWAATKPFPTASKQNEDLSISDSQQPVERLLASSPVNQTDSRILDVEDLPEDATPISSFSEKMNILKKSQWARDADMNPSEPVVPATSPTGNHSNLLEESVLVNDIDMLASDKPIAQEAKMAPGLLSATENLAPRHKEQSKSRRSRKSKGRDSMVEKGDKEAASIAVQSNSDLETTTVQEEPAIGFDLKMLDQINSGLGDDTTSFFKNSKGSQGSGGHSPATALKKSLPKVNTRKSTNTQPPPSPTAQAILRKAIKPPTSGKRGELGNRLSLKEIIAKTNCASKADKRPKKPKPIPSVAKPEVPSLETSEVVALVEEPQLVPVNETENVPEVGEPVQLVADRDVSPTRVADEVTSGQTDEGVDAVNEANDPMIDPEADQAIDQAIDQAVMEMPVPENLTMETQTETQPPLRLSQMPTPLPPSPLQLLNAAKHGTPNIPETVVEEEAPEKHVPVDTSLKENEPAFNPGPRRAKRTAPKHRSARSVDSQPSSNEELKAAITARKIATPISRLHQKMAEFSPVSPMVAPPVSPIPESQPQLDSQKSSIRRQDQLREEQQKGSSQLSSPPPSSPPAEGRPVVKEIQTREPVVEVPASSKDGNATETVVTAESEREPEQVSNGAPLSPPQDSHEESTIELSSGQFQRIAESMQNAGPVAIPRGTGETTVSYIPASHPEPVNASAPPNADILGTGENQPEIPRSEPMEKLDDQRSEPTEKPSDEQPKTAAKPQDDIPTATAETTTDVSIDSQDLDLPPKRKISEPTILVPETPTVDTQASRVTIPESFKRAIAAPINLAFQTPGAPLPPPFVPTSTGGFTRVHHDDDVTITSPSEPRATAPTNGDSTISVTVSSPVNTIEFTPFRDITSPRRSTQQSNTDGVGDVSVHEPTTIMSPFTFSQFMKPVESQYEVSEMVKGKDRVENNQDDRPSSYDFENVLGGVDDYLMSDVYDVEAEARQLSESQSFGKDGEGRGGFRSNQRASIRR
ncbi:hypothetical protein AA313_de0202472 [Arthrobotrys entomopaga]|nr:hypothetical protein AA313_de0202472 [Arthrobotrys entomopaga]